MYKMVTIKVFCAQQIYAKYKKGYKMYITRIIDLFLVYCNDILTYFLVLLNNPKIENFLKKGVNKTN